MRLITHFNCDSIRMKFRFKNIWILYSVLSVITACISKAKDEKLQSYSEVVLKDFVLSTTRLTEKEALKNLDSILNRVSEDSSILRQTISFLETPFSDPNSAYRNQNLYSKLLYTKIQSKWFNNYEREIAAGKLKLLQQNNVGSPANDFTYITPAGYKKKMYDIESKFILLYFNNPECNACKQMKQVLTSSTIINQKLKAGELKLLSIYTDKDEKLWLKHLKEYPANWIQGRDENEYLYKNNIYDLHAIPTLYLLDSNKKVLLKDVVNLALIENKLLG